MGRALLKLLAIAVALLFLGGAVLTAMSDVAFAAGPAADAGADSGVERTFFHPTKSAPLPRPRARDGGAVYFPASKSFGGGALPGVNEQLGDLEPKPKPQQSPQQNAAP